LILNITEKNAFRTALFITAEQQDQFDLKIAKKEVKGKKYKITKQ
jgi:hypothetical protein